MTVNKYDHVRQAKQSRSHHCHWPTCELSVAPARWGCRGHWYSLPQWLRNKIWAAYHAGQEETLSPSRSYVEVAQEAQDWIAEKNTDEGRYCGARLMTRRAWICLIILAVMMTAAIAANVWLWWQS